MKTSLLFQNYVIDAQYYLLYSKILRQQQYLNYIMSLQNSGYNYYLPNINQETYNNNEYLWYIHNALPQILQNNYNYSQNDNHLQTKIDNNLQKEEKPEQVNIKEEKIITEPNNILTDTTFKKGKKLFYIYFLLIIFKYFRK